MKILQNDYILKSLDLPTIEWKQYYTDTEFAQNILWSIKVEEIPLQNSKEDTESKKKRFLFSFRRDKRGCGSSQTKGLIGIDAKKAKEFGEKKHKTLDLKKQAIIYYPYYTVAKSGILDINRNRIVIEGTKGDISNMVTHNQVEVTMIFSDEDLSIEGEDKFFSQEEVLPLIDYGREVRKMAAQDLEKDKNIQLYFSYVYKTNEMLRPEGELQLIFYKFKLF